MHYKHKEQGMHNYNLSDPGARHVDNPCWCITVQQFKS